LVGGAVASSETVGVEPSVGMGVGTGKIKGMRGGSGVGDGGLGIFGGFV